MTNKINLQPDKISPEELVHNINRAKNNTSLLMPTKRPIDIVNDFKAEIGDDYLCVDTIREAMTAASEYRNPFWPAFANMGFMRADIKDQWTPEDLEKLNPPKKDYPKASVQEVHKAFLTSSKSILEQVNKILTEQSDKELEEMIELEQLGFTNISGMNEKNRERIEILEAKRKKGLIDKYNKKHSGYVFILEEEIKRICIKYGLVSGDVSRYIGDIPRENRTEIINFTKTHPKFSSQRLGIIATKDLFNFRHDGLHRDEIQEYEIVDKDPIVTYKIGMSDYQQSCLGRLIISKWGDELDIKELQ